MSAEQYITYFMHWLADATQLLTLKDPKDYI